MNLRFLLLTLLGAFLLVTSAFGGAWTTNQFAYKPALGARGEAEKAVFDSGLDRVDTRLGKEYWVGDPALGGTLAAAVTAIGSNPAILRLASGTHAVTNDLTVPANITLAPERGAVLAIATTKTLTLNGGLLAGPWQVFSCAGTGKVVFGSNVTRLPQWWGAKGDNVTDDSTAFNAAFASITAVGGCVDLGGYSYYIASVVDLPGASTYDQTTVRVRGDGATLRTDQPITIFRRHVPAGVSPNTYTQFSFVFDGLNFRGNFNRHQIGLDLGASYNPRVVNCRFDYLGIGLRLAYGLLPSFTNCMADFNVVAGYVITYGKAVWGDTFEYQWESVNGTFTNCRAAGGGVTQVNIAGLSRAAACAVTWNDHGLSTGDLVFIDGITQANWTALNHRRFAITKIDDNSFSIPVNTSGYADDYNAAADPGWYAAWAGGFMFIDAYGMELDGCYIEGSPCIDAIYFKHSGQTWLTIHQQATECAVLGSTLYLNILRGLVYTGMGYPGDGTTCSIDAYDCELAGNGVIHLDNYTASGGAKIRLPADSVSSHLAWEFDHSGNEAQGYNPDMTDSAKWWAGKIPLRLIIRRSQSNIEAFPYGEEKVSSSFIFRAGFGGKLRKDAHLYDAYLHWYGDWPGFKVESTDATGGVGVYDPTNSQATMLRQKSQEITITASGTNIQDVSGFIPAGSMVIGFTARVTAAIGGASDLSIGTTVAPTLWISAMGVALDSTGDLQKATATGPVIYPSATTVRLQGNGNFDGTGKVRITCHYLTLEAPGS
jgi:hypothetical protein